MTLPNLPIGNEERYASMWNALFPSKAPTKPEGYVSPLAEQVLIEKGYNGLLPRDKTQYTAPDQFWADPANVARYFNAYNALPDKTQTPEWFNPEALTAAYDYYSEFNKNVDWWDWKAPENDEMAPIMASVPPPPRDLLSPKDQRFSSWTLDDYNRITTAQMADSNGQIQTINQEDFQTLPAEIQDWLVQTQGEKDSYVITNDDAMQLNALIPEAQKVEGATVAQKVQELKQSGEWEQLSTYDRLMLSAQAAPYGLGGAASGALQTAIPAAVNLLACDVAGAVKTVATGATLGQLASGKPESLLTKASNLLMNAMNAGGETITRVSGFLGQVGGSIMAPEWYGSMDELMKSLPEAWQAADITYAAAFAKRAHQLGSTEYTEFEGEEADALRSIVALRRELTDVYEGRSAKTFDEVIYGYKDAQEIVDKYMSKYGVEGTTRDFIGQLVADPINFSGVMVSKLGEKIATKLGLEELAKVYRSQRYLGTLSQAFSETVGKLQTEGYKGAVQSPSFAGMGGGLDGNAIAGLRKYLGDMHKNPSPEAGKYGIISLLSGVAQDKDGTWKPTEFIKDPKNVISPFQYGFNYLFGQSPKSQAIGTMNDVVEAMNNGMHQSDIDNTMKLRGIINQYANVDPKVAGDVGSMTMAQRFLSLAPTMLREKILEVSNKLIDTYDDFSQQRDILNRLGAVIGENGQPLRTEEIFQKILDDKTFESTYKLAIEKLLTGDDEMKQFAQDLTNFTPEQVRDMAVAMKKGNVALTLDQLKTQIQGVTAKGTMDWGMKWFGVEEDPTITRLSTALKNMESLVLLVPNPSFFMQNVLTNTGHLFLDELMSFDTMNQKFRDKYWAEEFGGEEPIRRKTGFSEGEGVKGEEITKDAMDALGDKLSGGKRYATDKVVSYLRKKLGGGFATWSAKHEGISADIAYTNGVRQAVNQLTQDGIARLTPDQETAFKSVGLDPSTLLYNKTKGTVNLDKINTRLGDTSKPDYDQFRTPGLDEKLDGYGIDLNKFYDELSVDNIDKTDIETARRLSKTMQNKMYQNGFDLIVKAEGEQKVPVLINQINEANGRMMGEHIDRLTNAYEATRTMPAEAGKKLIEKTLENENVVVGVLMQAEVSKLIGMANGLGINTENIGLAKMLSDQHIATRDFYDTTMRLWRLFFEDSDASKVELAGRLEKILGEKIEGEISKDTLYPLVKGALTQEYIKMTDNAKAAQQDINDVFLQHLIQTNPSGEGGFRTLFETQSKNRDMTVAANLYFRTGVDNLSKLGEDGVAVKQQIDKLTNGASIENFTGDEHIRIYNKFQQEIYKPLWMKGIIEEAIIEKQANAQAQGTAEPIPVKKTEAKESVAKPELRMKPIDDFISDYATIAKSEQTRRFAELERLYGLASETPQGRVSKIKAFVKKYLGRTIKMEEWSPELLREALSKMPEDAWLKHWMESNKATDFSENAHPAPVVSPVQDVASSKLTPDIWGAQMEEWNGLHQELMNLREKVSNYVPETRTGSTIDYINQKVAESTGLKGSALLAEQKKYQNIYNEWLGNVKKNAQDIRYHAINRATQARDFALLNYNSRSRADDFLTHLLPYHFWYTHSMMNWAIRALDRPAMMAAYAKYKRYMDKMTENLPTRLKGKVFLKLPFLPEWMGEGLYIDPLRNVIPIDRFLQPLKTYDDQNNQQYKSAINILQDMVDDGQITYEEAEAQAKAKSGAAWEQAWTQAGSNLEKSITNPMDFVTAMTSSHLPIQWLYNKATGKPTSSLPVTRLVQNITGSLGITSDKEMFGGLISPAGVNLGFLTKDALGTPVVDQFHDYRVDRELGRMAQENPEMSDQLTQAMIDRSGDLYNEAVSRVMKIGLGRYMGSLVALDFFPESEAEQRKLRGEYAIATDKYASGDTTALTKFYDEHPEYTTQQAVWRDPEQRMAMYLRSQVWEAYNALPDLYKKQVAQSFGELFQTAFLNKDTRSYDSIDNNTMASWANALGAIVPETAQISQIPIALSDENLAHEVQVYNDYRDTYFPNIGDKFAQYNNIPDEFKEVFWNQNPDLEQYTNWRDTYMAEHPNIIEFIQSENSELSGLPTYVQQAVYQYRKDARELFPNIDATQSEYFRISDPALKRAFMLDHPELEKYWNWRSKYSAENPEAAPYILSDQTLKSALGGTDFQVEDAFPGIYDIQNEYFSYPKGSVQRRTFLNNHPELLTYWDWKGLYGDSIKAEQAFVKETIDPIIQQMSSQLISQLLGYAYANQTLTSGAHAELENLWVANGKLGGDLQTFIDLLKNGF